MFEVLYFLLIVLGLSVIIFVHEGGHFFIAKLAGLLIEEFGIGYPPRIAGKKIGETIYGINWVPFGAFVKIYGMQPDEERPEIKPEKSFSRQSIFWRSAIIAGGVIGNFIFGWLLLSIVFMSGLPKGLVIAGTVAGGIADVAGIKASDFLADYASVDDFKGFIDANKGKEVSLKIRRGEEIMEFKLVPRAVVPEGEGNLGIMLSEFGFEKSGFFAAIGKGFIESAGFSKDLFIGILRMIKSLFVSVEGTGELVGPVGIFSLVYENARLGGIYFINLLAMISLNFAVLNIFPIPGLDGGWLMFLLIEKLKGRRLEPASEKMIHAAGFMFLILLMAALTIRDIIRLF